MSERHDPQTSGADVSLSERSSGTALTWSASQFGVTSRRVAQREVSDLVAAFTEVDHARFADFFGSLEGGTLVLRVVFALDDAASYAILEWEQEGDEYPALSPMVPAAFVEECEVYEQFGVRPAGVTKFNRVVVPPGATRDFPRLGSAPKVAPRSAHAAHLVAGEIIEFPYGPVRAVAQESLYMGLVTSGEEVIDLYLLKWHKHRGVERRLQGRALSAGSFLVERVEGLSAVANALAYCRASEVMLGLVVTDDVLRTRAVALELERLYNHLSAMVALAASTGLFVAQAQAEVVLEELLRLNVAASGHRYLFNLVTVGGVSRSLDSSVISERLPRLKGEVRRVTRALLTTNSFLDRLEACGVVGGEAAHRLGLVGPVARASGCDLDARRDHPSSTDLYSAIVVPCGTTGDVMARTNMMLAELDVSFRLIEDLVAAGLGTGVVTPSSSRGRGDALGWAESARGESLAWLSADEDGRVTRARIRPASTRNWRAFDDAARSRNVFTDVPIIEASFWLTVAGLAR